MIGLHNTCQLQFNTWWTEISKSILSRLYNRKSIKVIWGKWRKINEYEFTCTSTSTDNYLCRLLSSWKSSRILREENILILDILAFGDTVARWQHVAPGVARLCNGNVPPLLTVVTTNPNYRTPSTATLQPLDNYIFQHFWKKCARPRSKWLKSASAHPSEKGWCRLTMFTYRSVTLPSTRSVVAFMRRLLSIQRSDQ